MDQLKIGKASITWLDGGKTRMDGGAMFGPVPKKLWSRRYPANADNQIELPTDPMLLEINGKHYLLDAGIGRGRLSNKQKKIFGATEESRIEEDLKKLNLKPSDIDGILMTHLHFDHVTGLVKRCGDKLLSLFPKAAIFIERREWEAVRFPSKRTQGTYWADNWQPIEAQVRIFDDTIEVEEGIQMGHTGGHSPGHCFVKITQGFETAVYLSDVFPTHAHLNPLWVTAFDDYPLESIEAKEKWITEGIEQDWTFLYYHDAYYRAAKYSKETREMTWHLKCTKPSNLPIELND
ncbi:metallo-beta-lactamase family protein [Alkalibacterium sp. AK22]|uniref:MBL fold metallo-hydrolase n=1 Tax=Alkalibacterium sp. AK22 TaxID=1229520 RepID=UPI000448A762|nr:MBL fold metallo-hydrolase [Alkalibacterium sp. AK22]EXJ22926.1 metallo-beta-lactamase family protein [Alkalibacterium sp. AK22]